MPDPTPDAYAAILTAIAASSAARGGDLDIRIHLRVATWVLESMADTFAMLAFANACDECDDAGTPHPDKPGPGGNFEDHPEPSDAVRADAERAAVRLYAAILGAPGGYDPAPALLRWWEAGNDVPRRWKVGNPDRVNAPARCWGHYAVMSAVGHGVCWEDDNAPLTNEAYPDGIEADVRDLEGVSAEDIEWSDAPTDAARAVLDGREGGVS